MTPIHALFSTIEPSKDPVDVLLDSHSYHCMLDCRDANVKLATDYLVSNWTETPTFFIQPILQRWMLDPLVHSGRKLCKARYEVYLLQSSGPHCAMKRIPPLQCPKDWELHHCWRWPCGNGNSSVDGMTMAPSERLWIEASAGVSVDPIL